VLADSRAHEVLSLSAICDWVLSEQDLPPQRHRPFGQPPVNLYVAPNFFIEANVWLSSGTTTSIHEHAFAGAFCLLEGITLHSHYRFSERQRINDHLQLGSIELVSTETLRPGDVRAIEPGEAFIHSAFHLERPSISLVIRTEGNVDGRPQYEYHPPALALDPRHNPQPLRTQLDLLDTVAELDPEAYFDRLQAFLAESNAFAAIRVVERAFRRLRSPSALQRVEGLLAERHPGLAEAVCSSLREMLRRDVLLGQRTKVKNAGARLFIGLLSSMSSWAAMEPVIQREYPEREPEECVLEWVLHLSEVGAASLRFDAISLEVLRSQLRRETRDGMLVRLCQLFPDATLERRLDEVDAAVRNIRKLPWLAPVFDEAVPAPGRL
jgi:hypothetical protein